MKLYSENKDYKLYNGSMLDMLEVIEPNTIDSIVTDPPYGLTSITKRFGKENSAECQYGKDGSFARLSRGFMGKEWDGSGIEYNIDTWKKCYEVLKPGGYLLAFGGSRTFHRIACAIEDAGFEIRDTIMWLYGSGFPKSMDISKQIDKRNKNTKKEYIRFGNYLKLKREEKGINKTQLGKLIYNFKRSEDTPIRSFEKGINLPPKEVYLKLKKILGLNNDFDWLIEREGAEREVIGIKKGVGCFNNDEHYTVGGTKANDIDITTPSTDLAKQWQGWGTALKPSFEPIIVARKPFKGSLVDNVIEYGVGGINIDECRVQMTENDKQQYYDKQKSFENTYQNKESIYEGNSLQKSKTSFYDINTLTKNTLNLGRFPANTILTYDETDFDEVCGGFPQSKGKGHFPKNNKNGNSIFNTNNLEQEEKYLSDSGSASRYFYCAKASKKDRDEGLDDFIATTDKAKGNGLDRVCEFCGVSQLTPELCHCENKSWITKPKKNTHPTVKPTELMQYLVRLVTPNNGVVLDPFNGSGSTGKAVMYENKERNKNYKYIGIELTEEYLPIAKARIEYVCNLIEEDKLKDKQMSIFDIGESNE